MATSFTQTNTVANASAVAPHCSGNSDNGDTESNQAEVGGSAGSARTITLDSSAADLNCVWTEIINIDDYDGASGNWTWRINITTSNHQVTLDEVHICHVDSSYAAKNTLGGTTGIGSGLGATGVLSGTINQSAGVSIAAGDKIIVIFAFDNAQAMTNDFGYTPDQVIDAPGTIDADITIAVPVGSLSATGQTPLAITGFVIDVPVGSLVLTGLAPTANIEIIRTPSLGTLVLTGGIPTLVQTDNHIRAPPVGTGVFTGFAPTVVIGTTIAVPVGSLTLEGFPPPTVNQPSDFGLRLTGFIPTVTVTVDGNVIRNPPVGTLTLTGLTPTVEITHVRQPAAGTLTLTGLIPTAITGDNVVVTPDVGTLTLAGQAPTVEITHVREPAAGALTLTGQVPSVEIDVVRRPAAGSLNITGFAPTVEITHIRQPGAGALTILGQIPAIITDESRIAQPGTGSLTLTGAAPVLVQEFSIDVPVGSLVLSGFAPNVEIDVTRLPGVGALSLTGFAPSVEITHIRQPGVGSLTLTGFVPTVNIGVPSATINAPALTEPLLVAGGQIITITLTNETWVSSGSAFDQVRQIILNGLTSAQTEDKGWNREVRDKQPVTAVVRTSNTVVTITLTASSGYDITVGEVITDTVPDEALNSSTTPLVATPTIGVTADAPILQAHTVGFSSVSRVVKFSSTQRRVTFSSASRTIKIADTPNPLGFILTEDDGIILQEDDLPIALE